MQKMDAVRKMNANGGKTYIHCFYEFFSLFMENFDVDSRHLVLSISSVEQCNVLQVGYYLFFVLVCSA